MIESIEGKRGMPRLSPPYVAQVGLFNRPTLVPVPTFALRIVLGEFAGEITASQRVLPQALLDAGFTFEQPDVDDAMRAFAAD